jgi:hypothetical protein
MHKNIGLVLAFFACALGCEPSRPSGPRERVTVTFTMPQSAAPARSPLSPIEQPADLGQCRVHHGRRPYDRDIAGWFQAVADDTSSTVEIISAILYGIKEDGTIEAIGGGVAWAGYYGRSPWFPPGDQHDSIAPSSNFYVRQDRVLHGGSGHASLDGYVDAIYVVTVRTTGSARVQVGIDYRPAEGSSDVNERALSDWFAGNGVMHSTPDPRSSQPSCIPTFHTETVLVSR